MVERNTTTRRTAIKNIGAVATVATLFGHPATASGSDVKPTDARAPYNHTHNAFRKTVDAHGLSGLDFGESTAVGIRWLGSYSTYNTVTHQFVGSCLNVLSRKPNSYSDWELLPQIYDYELEMVDDSPINSSLWTPDQNDRRLVAAVQSDGSSLNWEEGLSTTIQVVGGDMSPVASALTGAQDIYNAFTNDNDSASGGSKSIFSWDFSSTDRRAAVGASSRFNIESDLPGDEFDTVVRTNMSTPSPPGDQEGDETIYIGARLIRSNISPESQSKDTEVIPAKEIDDPYLKEFADGEDLRYHPPKEDEVTTEVEYIDE